MLRLLLLVVVALAAAVWIEPDWRPDARELRLRVRDTREALAFVVGEVRALRSDAPAAVGAGPPPEPEELPAE